MKKILRKSFIIVAVVALLMEVFPINRAVYAEEPVGSDVEETGETYTQEETGETAELPQEEVNNEEANASNEEATFVEEENNTTEEVVEETQSGGGSFSY